MVKIKKIELPRKIIIGKNAIHKIKETIESLDLTRPLIISDKITKKFGAIIHDKIGGELAVVGKNFNYNKIKTKKVDFVCGVGGGKIIDIAKYYGFKNKLPVISIPTAASHDGISSPQVSLGEGCSTKVNVPIAIIADTKIIKNAPKKLTASGFGDIISNYTAVLDWQLANNKTEEYYNDYSASLSKMSAEFMIKNSKKIFNNASILVEALINSGIAMAIAGSSRPCSGAEHMFSHAIDKLSLKYSFKKALHGEQCGVGTIISAYLHKTDWKKIKKSLKDMNAPINVYDLKIEKKYIIEALKLAPKIRNRYTIFNKYNIKKDAEKILTECEVI